MREGSPDYWSTPTKSDPDLPAPRPGLGLEPVLDHGPYQRSRHLDDPFKPSLFGSPKSTEVGKLAFKPEPRAEAKPAHSGEFRPARAPSPSPEPRDWRNDAAKAWRPEPERAPSPEPAKLARLHDGLNATGDDGVLEHVSWKDDRAFLRAVCSSEGSVDFRIRLKNGKAVTVQFDSRRLTTRAVQQQIERLEKALPALHPLEVHRIRLAFDEALALRDAADKCELFRALPMLFDAAEPPDIPATKLRVGAGRCLDEHRAARHAGYGHSHAHELFAAVLPAALLASLGHWAEVEEKRQAYASQLPEAKPGPVQFPEPRVPLERPVTGPEVDQAPSATMQKLDDVLEKQIRVGAGPNFQYQDPEDASCELRQCMTGDTMKKCAVM